MSRPRAGTRAAELRKLLLRGARSRQEDFQVTLSRYGVERLLYRLSTSRHADSFILKGAMLVGTWAAVPHRATRDVDFLGLGDAAPARLIAVFREIAGIDGGDDAIVFDPESIRAEEIREDDRYGGVRVLMTAEFGGAMVPVQIDVGFGDAVEPAAEWIEFPTLLELPTPRIRAYTRYSVVSEKLEAIVSLGMVNSRMKDFYDLWVLSRDFDFDGAQLGQAVRATFNRRGTPLPAVLPVALGEEFVGDPEKQRQWSAFVSRGQLRDAGVDLGRVVPGVRDFVWPVLAALAAGGALPRTWPPRGPWG